MSEFAPLLGRGTQLEAIEGLLHRAGEGDSGALALVGPAGTGKTSLLRAAESRAGEALLLRVRGIESEAEIAFAGLLELTHPLADLMARLPAPQLHALEGALALGPTDGTDRFSVAAATLGILELAAADRPVLVVVDDLHWLDPASTQAILFAARRLWREGVAILLSTRPEVHVVGQLEGITQLEVGPLEAEDAASLARATASRALVDDEIETLVVGTGGNPLAIVEATRHMGTSAEAMEGVVLPLPVAERIRVGVERRLESFGAAERTAVLVAAAAGTRASSGIVEAALAEEGLSLDDLGAAEHEGVLRVHGGTIEFEHPLTRSAVYGAEGGADQRRAHEVLARAFARDAPERAWHLAAAAVGTDPEAAEALEAVGRDAMARGAPSSALRAFERAVRLTRETEPAARRLLLSGEAARLAGNIEHARNAIALALEHTRDPLLRADALALLFQMDLWRAPVVTARTIAVEAERLSSLDPIRAARMLSEAAAALMRSGSITQGLEFAERAQAMIRAQGLEDDAVAFSVHFGLVMDARGPEVVGPLRLLGERVRRSAPTAQTLALLQQVAWAQTWMEDYESATLLLEHAVSVGRSQAPGALPMALATRAELAYRRGRWQTALADTTEAASLAAAFEQAHARGLALTCQARIEAVLGREEDCRATAREAATIGVRLGGEGSPVSAYGEPALGLLELAHGRPAEAITHLVLLVGSFQRGGIREPGVVLAAGDLVESYARCGRRADALALLEQFEAAALLTQRRGARAIAARCRGILAADDQFPPAFQEALAWHEGVDMPFERARTELALGERLRRARRRADARVHLREALDAFERLGAIDWARAASRELEVSGETATPRSGPRSDELTPQELQVALIVASGATNREAGARLFLSAKTVEAHLGRIYRKLGVRSRTELAARLAGERSGAPTPA